MRSAGLIPLVLMLSINLGGGFGEASAEVVQVAGETMNIDLEVAVEVSAASVVAHLLAPGEPELTLPLLQRQNGRFGIQTDLRIVDYRVVFEALGDVAVLSQGVSLSELGALLPANAMTTTTARDGFSPTAQKWGWLALGLAALALSLLAFWVLGGRDEASVEEDRDHEEGGNLVGEHVGESNDDRSSSDTR